MNEREQNQMLREILAGDDVTDVRQSSLEAGLALLRRQRRRRHTVRIVASLCLPCLLAITFLPFHRPAPQLSPALSAETARVKIIGDAELFALFPGRPLALIGRPGEQELVFLDQRSTEER